jgi:large subunit ribosomal protein L4
MTSVATPPTYTKSGAKATTAAKLDASVFGVEITSHELLKQAYDAYLANGRESLAVVKTRGLVRGGGKKPWRQKGTGRARFGSSRNPIWRGGGIVFGPTGEENYTKQINIKAKRLALRQALTLAAQNGKVIVVEDITSESAKTAVLSAALAKIGATGRVLVAVENVGEELARASRNLPDVTFVQPAYLNVFDVMNADKVVLSNVALETVTTRLSGASVDKQKGEK